MLLVAGTIEAGSACVVAESEIVPAEWQELAAEASEPNAYAEPWFVLPALAHLRGEGEVRVVESRDGSGRLDGVMLLCLSNRYGRMPVRHVSNWWHFQCFMGTPLIRRNREAAFCKAVLELLDGSDWAKGFLTVAGLLEGGCVHTALQDCGRPCPTVLRNERAALASDLNAEAYLEAYVRQKKRKELRRLANRLAETGAVSFATLDRADQLEPWCDAFLQLEASGWKGERGSAFANTPATEAFFREVVTGAFAAGRLDFQRLDLDGRAIGMLVNFRTPPGSWSFKIAYDETLARFSPGVMIELENMKRVLADPDVDWMDSCAVENHPMIDKLWAERRAIVQVTVPLAGFRRRATYSLCRSAERASAAVRRVLA